MGSLNGEEDKLTSSKREKGLSMAESSWNKESDVEEGESCEKTYGESTPIGRASIKSTPIGRASKGLASTRPTSTGCASKESVSAGRTSKKSDSMGRDLTKLVSTRSASIKRIVLNASTAGTISDWIKRLRDDSCRTDTSKLVNVMLKIFLQKYGSQEYENISKEFFHKKTYLKKLIHKASEEEIDGYLKKYVGKVSRKKAKSKN